MFELTWIYSVEAWTALLTLTVLEIILGIDNIIFISIIVEKLPEKQRSKARLIGLALAMVMRIILLLCITWVMGLKDELIEFVIPFANKSISLSGKDFILVIGGLFLIFKSTREIHHKIEGDIGGGNVTRKKKVSVFGVFLQIVLLDMIFSLDSVITAVGMAKNIEVMIIAVVVAVIVMMIFAGMISDFINKHPTLQMLALNFLILIGVALMGEGFDFHIPKGYIYFAMGFSLFVEILNIRLRSKRSIVEKITHS